MTGLRVDAPRRDVMVAVGAVILGGAGVAVTLAGAGMRDLNIALAGSATVAGALVVLIAGGWVDALICVAIALPLPPVYSSETLRVSPAAIVTLAALVGWALRRGFDQRPLSLGTLPRWSTAALLAAVIVTAVFAEQPGPALREVVSTIVMLGLLVAATDQLAMNPAQTRRLLWTLVLVLGGSGLAATAQALGAPPRVFPLAHSSFYRASLGFSGPTELGMFMGLGLPLAGYVWRTERSRVLQIVALACLVAGVLGLAATFSRGSWLAVVSSTVVLLLARQSRYAVQVWGAALVAALVIQVVSGGAVTGRITSELGMSSIDQRAALMMVGFLMFQAHPLLGVGPGGFPAALTRFGPQVPWLWDYVGAAHNAYVHMAAEAGIVGLTALVAFLGNSLLVLVRGMRALSHAPAPDPDEARLQRTLVWAFAMACAMGLVEWVFVHGVGELVMLIAAIGFARPRPVRA